MSEQESLLLQIECFLKGESRLNRERECIRFWDARNHITSDEMNVLASMAGKMLGLEDIARLLHRKPCDARPFLDGLIAIGLLEHRDGLFTTTPATDHYCQALRLSRTNLTGLD